VASTMGATFGIGPRHTGRLPGNWYAPQGQGVMPMNTLTFYSNHNYMVSGPRSGDLLGLFEGMREAGVRNVVLASPAPAWDSDFNSNGLLLFLRLANLTPLTAVPDEGPDSQLATLIRAEALGTEPPCVRLPDGTGVWIRAGDVVCGR
jgi:hypothetical protein